MRMLSAELLIEEDPAKQEKIRQHLSKFKVTVVTFGHEEWGVADVSLPRLREVVSDLECDGEEFFHNRVMLSFYGSSSAVQVALDRFRGLKTERDFERCRIGIAKGTGATPWLELLRIARDSEHESG